MYMLSFWVFSLLPDLMISNKAYTILEPGLVILVTMTAVMAFIVVALPGIVKGGNSTITVDPNTTTIRLVIECPYSKLGPFENENLQGCSFTYNKMDEGMFKCRLSGGGKLEVRTVKNEYTILNEKKLMYLRLKGQVIVHLEEQTAGEIMAESEEDTWQS